MLLIHIFLQLLSAVLFGFWFGISWRIKNDFMEINIYLLVLTLILLAAVFYLIFFRTRW